MAATRARARAAGRALGAGLLLLTASVPCSAQDMDDLYRSLDSAFEEGPEFSAGRFGLSFCKDLLRNPHNLREYLDPDFLESVSPRRAESANAADGAPDETPPLFSTPIKEKEAPAALLKETAEGRRFYSCGLKNDRSVSCDLLKSELKSAMQAAAPAAENGASATLAFSELEGRFKSAMECGVGELKTRWGTRKEQKEMQWPLLAIKLPGGWSVVLLWTEERDWVLPAVLTALEEKLGEKGKND